ncbi:unnamed protein product [Vitrella brassicaformis CCMP3155]|uniref:alpha-1,2-Mannosidase n=1 Tax=Vitrella brassicaformis (strain CCMP3155) TaxID=1169540 RepID=A0A0G4EWA4_VITBC|nr:unnamed protein product [Vitrella brassicaformis CCMP3155]|eukprot:CEM03237.1 unnamed protein product [Vitrella brassicaformis CCMP3155]
MNIRCAIRRLILGPIPRPIPTDASAATCVEQSAPCRQLKRRNGHPAATEELLLPLPHIIKATNTKRRWSLARLLCLTLLVTTMLLVILDLSSYLHGGQAEEKANPPRFPRFLLRNRLPFTHMSILSAPPAVEPSPSPVALPQLATVTRRQLTPAEIRRTQRCSKQLMDLLSEDDLVAMSLLQMEAFSAIRDYRQCPLMSNMCVSFSNYLAEESAIRKGLVRRNLRWFWHKYERHAFGSDEMTPSNGIGQNPWGGFGVMILDSMDTLFYAGLHEELDRALQWVADHLSFDRNYNVNVFETTIRQLVPTRGDEGTFAHSWIQFPPFSCRLACRVVSFRSIYSLLRPSLPGKEEDEMTEEEEKRRGHNVNRVLEEAISLGGRLLKAFPPAATPRQWSDSGAIIEEWMDGGRFVDVPQTSDVFLDNGKAANLAGTSCLAEIGSVQLEFKTLSHFTGDCSYQEAAEATTDLIERRRQVSKHGLVPVLLKPNDLSTHRGTISLGPRGDSFYEYLAKEWVLTGQQDELLQAMLLGFLRRLPELLSNTTIPPTLPQADWSKTHGDREGQVHYGRRGLVYVAEVSEHRRSKDPKMGHLTCFLPGVLMLLARTSLVRQPGEPPQSACQNGTFAPGCDNIDEGRYTYLERLADELCKTCVTMYFRTESGAHQEGKAESSANV